MSSRKHSASRDAQPKMAIPAMQHIQLLQAYKDKIEKILSSIEDLELLPAVGNLTELINTDLLQQVTTDLNATFVAIRTQQKTIYRKL
jgi:hypothetical protein